MNKKKFIKTLKSELSILEESEINDIIEEYSNIIEEKIKNGKTEEEAINDFGDIDELAKEILRAYKINPKFAEKTENTVGQDFESFVKDSANKLAQFTKSIASEFKDGGTIKVESVFEVLIKIIILLVALAVLRLPFTLISLLGDAILDMYFYPIDYVLMFIWHAIIWIFYIISCVFVGMAIFKNNIQFEDDSKKNEKVTKSSKTKVKEEIKEDIKEEKVKKTNNNYGSNILFIIVKIFAFMVFLLPLFCIIVSLCLGIAFLIYYIVMGINFWGLLLITLGLLVFFGHAYHAVNNILERKKNYYFIPLLVSVILVGVGGIISFHTIKDFDFISQPFGTDVRQFEYNIEDKMTLSITGNLYDKKVDDSLEDGQVIVKVYYYDDYVDFMEKTEGNNVEIYRITKENIWRDVYDNIIEDLKNNRYISYDKVINVRYEIIANTQTLKKVMV